MPYGEELKTVEVWSCKKSKPKRHKLLFLVMKEATYVNKNFGFMV